MKQWLSRHGRAGVRGLVAAGIAGAVLTAGGAYAATGALTSSAASPVQGCARPGGTIRVIQPTQHCRPNETPITLGQAGAPGPSQGSVLTGRINHPALKDHYWGAVSGISTGVDDTSALQTVQTLSPASARTARNLSVHIGAPAATSQRVAVLIEINNDVGPECMVMPGQTTCTDTTTEATVPPGSTLDVFVFTDVGFLPTTVSFGWELD